MIVTECNDDHDIILQKPFVILVFSILPDTLFNLSKKLKSFLLKT